MSKILDCVPFCLSEIPANFGIVLEFVIYILIKDVKIKNLLSELVCQSLSPNINSILLRITN